MIHSVQLFQNEVRDYALEGRRLVESVLFYTGHIE